MHDHIDPVETALEKVLIGLELELLRHDARCIGEHAVLGDNGITFDATGTGRRGGDHRIIRLRQVPYKRCGQFRATGLLQGSVSPLKWMRDAAEVKFLRHSDLGQIAIDLLPQQMRLLCQIAGRGKHRIGNLAGLDRAA
jgi:hypothetical protein